MKANTGNLICQDYQIRRAVGDMVRVEASFFLNININENERIGEAIKRINDMFSSDDGVSLVVGKNIPRCSFCGTLAKNDEVRICEQCGGGL